MSMQAARYLFRNVKQKSTYDNNQQKRKKREIRHGRGRQLTDRRET
jgi:hypothetical protein